MVPRQRRMKSYRNVAFWPRQIGPHSDNPVSQDLRMTCLAIRPLSEESLAGSKSRAGSRVKRQIGDACAHVAEDLQII